MSNCCRRNLLIFRRYGIFIFNINYSTNYVLQDVQANETRITGINQLAKKLLDEGHPDVSLIISKQKVYSNMG